MSDSYEYIDSTEQLEFLCKNLKNSEFITIDTEFIRETTFRPQLCLIQVANEEQAAIIDPMADGIDLSALFDILNDDKVVKVMHSGRQDIEIFYLYTGVIPKNVFDSQIAGMVCGFGESVGYEALVKKVNGKGVDKSARFSNWAQRPLTQKQLDYAISDVTHLRDVYKHLKQQMAAENREEWIKEEVDDLLDEANYTTNHMKRLYKIKLRSSNPHVLARAYALVEWREEQCEQLNKPRQTIMRDDLIAELATNPPKDIEQYRRTRGLRDRHLNKKVAEAIVSSLDKASKLDPSQCPKLQKTANEPSVDPLALELLRLLLKYTSEKKLVAEKILAPSKSLANLIRYGDKADSMCLKGWRYDIFGKQALALLDEKIGFSIKNGKVTIDEVSTN